MSCYLVAGHGASTAALYAAAIYRPPGSES